MVPLTQPMRAWRVLFTRHGFSDYEDDLVGNETQRRQKMNRRTVVAQSVDEAVSLARINFTERFDVVGYPTYTYKPTIVAVKPFVRLAVGGRP